ncbi:hydrolase [Flavobacteriaceae bacterium F89]|uniref:Hydrolase n=1 Tax=Cerina litoralis TaxID=2874477 RepID=A0AAE3EWG8_9FLAO|nr:hydrolase [Cerina litoralis]MCG2461409.1 hydrolase [Cerina litoralis]
MKRSIFLYLFVFMALIALYQYVSATHILNDRDEKIERLKSDTAQLQDSIQKLQIKVMDMQYFSLENNDDALAYYDHLKLKDPSRYIADKLLETNEQKGDNPLVPYEGMEGSFKINKIKLLNHKWIIADFSDGKYWGELLIKYELKDDLGVDFTLMDHLLYSKR